MPDRPGQRVIGRALRTSWAADRRGTVVATALQAVGALSALGVVLASKLALDAVLTGPGEIGVALVLALVLLAVATALSSSVGVLQKQQQRLLGEMVGQMEPHEWHQVGACRGAFAQGEEGEGQVFAGN